jgi:hypothetical protein
MTSLLGADLDRNLDDIANQTGGARVSATQVSWQQGTVILDAAPTQASTLRLFGSWHGCPKGWFCFYQHEKWGGRMLRFSNCPPGGLAQYFTDYGFENQTTSWTVNRSLNFVNVNDFASNLWNESAFSASSNVGTARNDRADYFICYG